MQGGFINIRWAPAHTYYWKRRENRCFEAMTDENQRKKQKTAGLGDGGSSSCVTSGNCIEGGGDSDFAPFSNLVTPMLTDMYQLTMCYGYWTAKRHEMTAVFDLYFRKAPFHGTFTIFGGLSQVLAFLNTYKITSKHIDYFKTLMPTANPKIIEWPASEVVVNRGYIDQFYIQRIYSISVPLWSPVPLWYHFL